MTAQEILNRENKIGIIRNHLDILHRALNSAIAVTETKKIQEKIKAEEELLQDYRDKYPELFI